MENELMRILDDLVQSFKKLADDYDEREQATITNEKEGVAC
ncbi:hypothetical protein [Jeotgalibaca sp. MA1X17-3]|nr:hypothetical protein [Jeotgalibaca sp. MA1X17-3]